MKNDIIDRHCIPEEHEICGFLMSGPLFSNRFKITFILKLLLEKTMDQVSRRIHDQSLHRYNNHEHIFRANMLCQFETHHEYFTRWSTTSVVLARPLLRLCHLNRIFSHFGRRAWEIAVVYKLIREGKGRVDGEWSWKFQWIWYTKQNGTIWSLQNRFESLAL